MKIFEIGIKLLYIIPDSIRVPGKPTTHRFNMDIIHNRKKNQGELFPTDNSEKRQKAQLEPP
jgi:hypothetical protein